MKKPKPAVNTHFENCHFNNIGENPTAIALAKAAQANAEAIRAIAEKCAHPPAAIIINQKESS